MALDVGLDVSTSNGQLFGDILVAVAEWPAHNVLHARGVDSTR